MSRKEVAVHMCLRWAAGNWCWKMAKERPRNQAQERLQISSYFSGASCLNNKTIERRPEDRNSATSKTILPCLFVATSTSNSMPYQTWQCLTFSSAKTKFFISFYLSHWSGCKNIPIDLQIDPARLAADLTPESFVLQANLSADPNMNLAWCALVLDTQGYTGEFDTSAWLAFAKFGISRTWQLCSPWQGPTSNSTIWSDVFSVPLWSAKTSFMLPTK